MRKKRERRVLDPLEADALKRRTIARRKIGNYKKYEINPNITGEVSLKDIEISRETFEKIRFLSKPAIVVLAFIIKTMKEEDETIRLSPSNMQLGLDYKSTSNIFIGISDLLHHEFIFRTTKKGRFFINFNYKKIQL